MKKIISTIFACFAMLVLLSFDAQAQEALKQKPSPLGMVTYSFEDTYVKVTYGRPHLRGRESFTATSELAPLGKVWRTGANEATEITVTDTINMAGEVVPAGTYSVFTIPGAKSWTIILNKDVGQWGAYKYDEEKDLLRFEVPVSKSDQLFEPFTIRFDQVEGEVSLQMIWANTMVSIPIEF
ncbi:DUF2911 domain-containing protein [Marivirga harenae]|uniref:DUF2911 domain-containing protein n=1 Tax=Marivirga harenae TaxID=2010992 RepID=UPI0026E0FFF4|nr:DUF2911 domain-containing protein [Marivirga harenae]WKV11052.1 DUF2911 domain-containing protein [Marivirga harenae]|tara:strand:+ start:142408 stop:142953 length:546 start_codon:yes stop_codon:yes gene_type:complete